MVMTPIFEISIQLSLYFMSYHDLNEPFYLLKKIGLSVSYLVSEILEPKFGQIFHQNVLYLLFLRILYHFLLDFRSN